MSTYYLCIGLPVSVTVSPDGTLDFEVDVSELADEVGGDEVSVYRDGEDEEVTDTDTLTALAERITATLAKADQFPYAVIPALPS